MEFCYFRWKFQVIDSCKFTLTYEALSCLCDKLWYCRYKELTANPDVEYIAGGTDVILISKLVQMFILQNLLALSLLARLCS
jgi:hypothetical protein